MTDFNDIALARHLREEQNFEDYWEAVAEIQRCYGLNERDAEKKLADQHQHYLEDIAAERAYDDGF